jgi:hypothetical protein
MVDVKLILEKEIVPTLTDMKGNQFAFWDAFEYSFSKETPIKTILELGIMRLKPGIVNVDLPGQSTKIFMTLGCKYGVDKHVSLDIDSECKGTTDRCKSWVSKYGVVVNNHEFVASDSMKYDSSKQFPNGIDLILLDTNHDDDYPEKTLGFKGSGGAGMTYREICRYAPLLSKNGRLFIHDTKMFYVPKGYGVNTEGAVQRFLDENPDYDFVEHARNNVGLGEIFRKDSNVAQQYKKN